MRQPSNSHVLFYASGRKNGCSFYRIIQPGRKMVQHDLMPAALSSDMEPAECQVWVDKAGAIYSQNLENEKFLDWMADEQKQGRKLILDYDDDPFHVSPFNPAYEKRGTCEVKFEWPDGTTAEWKDGKDGFCIEENVKRLQTFARALHQADLVTTTTSVLKDLFSRYSYRVRQLRNMVDLNVWRPLNLVKDEWVRIIYQGGWSHYMDFMEVKEALEKVLEAYPNVKLVVMGQWYPGVFGGRFQDRIELHDWADVELYPWIFKTLNADIGICPLENTQFNSAKSEIKWVEYSALKIPTVSSAVRPYCVAMDHGKTGFVAKDSDEWAGYLSNLIEDEQLRKDVGEEARRRIEDIYDVDKRIGIYKTAFMNCFDRGLISV